MKKLLLLLLIFLNITFVSSQEVHKRIAINNPSQALQEQISSMGIDLSCGIKHDHGRLVLELSDLELGLLKTKGIVYTTEIENLTKFYSDRINNTYDEALRTLEFEKLRPKSKKTSGATKASKSVSSSVLDNFLEYVGCDEIDWVTPSNFNLGSMGGCLTISEVEAELDQMRTLYPNLISEKADVSPTNQTTWGNPSGSITNNGLTYSGQGTTNWNPQTIYYSRITGNEGSTPQGTRPESLYTSMIHSREVGSLMSNIYFMWYLLENYATNTAVKNLVDNNELYFIPVVNPDGLKWNEHLSSSGGGMQRKNCRPNAGSTSNSTSTRGVDLNRNFDYFWGTAGTGSSATPSSDSYRGPSAASEPETQILVDFVLSHNFKSCLMNHTTSNAIPHPFGGNPANVTGKENEMHKWHEDMTRYNRYVYGATIFDPANGIADDWMVGGAVDGNGSTGSGQSILATTPEHGDTGFWPPVGDILNIARRSMRLSLTSIYYAGTYAKFHDLTQSNIPSLTSDLTFGIERLGQTSSNFTLTVTPISSNITSIATIPAQTSMTILEQRNVTAQMVLNAGIQPNDKIEYNVQLSDGSNVFYNVNFEKYYQPTELLSDNPDSDLLTNWTTSGTWTASTASGAAYSGTRGIKVGANVVASLGNNDTRTLTTASAFDLSGSSEVIVQFYTKWDLERNYDFVELQGSTNGTTWQSLCGKYNKPNSSSSSNSGNFFGGKNGTSNSFQANNSSGRVYDGDRFDNWVMEEIVIDASNNSFLNGSTTAQFRFRFRTDANNKHENYTANAEGFFIDDFKVITIDVPCVVSVPNNVSISAITETTATVNWNNIPSTTYDIRYKETSSGTWNEINGLTSNSTGLTGLALTTDYEVQVRSNCGANNSAYSASVNFTTLDIQLNYCDSASTNVNDEFISRVQLNTIDNSSGAQFYSDFTSISTTLTKDEQYTITLTPTWTGTVYTEAYSVWIDYNRDGDFEDSGEQVFTQAATNSTSVSGNFTIPSSAVENSTRMRLSMQYNTIPTSCQTFQYGEVEDYTVIIESSGPDIVAPVITLNGTSPMDITVGGNYTEEGATALDDTDGDISNAIIVGGDIVNTNVLGVYVITYNVSDAAGNVATEVTRMVNITPDVTAPVITLLGASTVNLNLGESYIEDGATATDNVDGDVSSNIVIGGDIVNPNMEDVYIITFNVSDAAGNAATQVSRTVNVSAIVDTTAPTIVLNGASSINLTVGDTYNEFGATATDDIDGDITANIVVGGNVVDTNTAGNYTITYNVSDAAGNAATQLIRTVAVTDPISGCTSGITVFPYSEGFEGSIGNWTQSTNDDLNWLVNSGTTPSNNTGPSGAAEGSSYIFVEASVNGGGYPNKRAIITSPCFDLSIATEATFSFQYHMFGSADMGTIDLEISNDDGASWVSIWNQSGNQGNSWLTVDLNLNAYTGGSVQLRFNRFVGSTWQADIALDAINVTTVEVDSIAPVITLNGNASIDLNVGDSYTEQGATASDNKDGDITANMVTGGDVVDTNTAGTYTVTYDVSDAAGNAATQVVRTVNVIPDTTAPVITLNGNASIDLNLGDSYSEQGATASDNKDGDITASIVIGGDVVDTNTAGTYTVTYNVSDAAGNAATQVTRTVNVIPDTTAPIITLNGNASIDLNVGVSYSEQGATASDNKDGDITANIVIGGDVVDTNTAGTYTVTYNVSDAAGNAATQVTRTVNVIPDTTAPIITLNGSLSIDLNVGDGYNELGATASDNLDGDITANIVIGGDVVDTIIAGTYTVTYNVSDAAGNAATQVTRTVNVIPDTTAPIITLNGNASIDLNVGDGYNELGATASDNKDGDITANIVIGGDVVDTNTGGTYTVTYNVNDAAGNAAIQVIRLVNVIPDTTAPVITLDGSSSIDLNVGYSYTEQGATASDNKDGDITANIVIGGDVVDTNTAGTYTVTYDVSDAAGNAATQVTRVVNVIPDTTAPEITLNGNASIDLNVGDSYTEQGAMASDNIDGNITENIVIGGLVDTNAAGTYIVTYNVSDSAGNAASQVIRTVIVNDIPTDVVIHEGYFESGWDGWIDGGSDCARRLDAARSFEGNYSIRIRDNSGTASSMTSPTFDLSSYSSVEFNFHFFSNSMEVGEDFWLQYNDGSGFVTIETWARGTDFNNNAFGNYSIIFDASQYNLSSNAQFRLRCDASGNNDHIYVDQVVITGYGGSNTLFIKQDTSKDDSVLDVTENVFTKNKLTLFPNPVGAILNVKTSKGGKMTFRIINSLGQIVNTGETSKEIIVDNLEAGMYFIEVTNNKDKMMKRFIKE